MVQLPEDDCLRHRKGEKVKDSQEKERPVLKNNRPIANLEDKNVAHTHFRTFLEYQWDGLVSRFRLALSFSYTSQTLKTSQTRKSKGESVGNSKTLKPRTFELESPSTNSPTGL
jgi:hypothetical protein